MVTGSFDGVMDPPTAVNFDRTCNIMIELIIKAIIWTKSFAAWNIIVASIPRPDAVEPAYGPTNEHNGMLAVSHIDWKLPKDMVLVTSTREALVPEVSRKGSGGDGGAKELKERSPNNAIPTAAATTRKMDFNESCDGEAKSSRYLGRVYLGSLKRAMLPKLNS
ncbi:hypothetical protein RUND412_003667 [Rhizina undulata]